MRRADAALLGLSGAFLLAVAIPVIAQGGPTSLLPDSFNDPVPSPTPTPAPAPSQQNAPSLQVAPSILPGGPVNAAAPLALPELPGNAAEAEVKDPNQYDLPPTARRSLAQVGPLTTETGGVAANAFGSVRGHFLSGLMRAAHAPFVSRWASITLRRVLLSGTATPGDVSGADLVAERAALLLRMGEADGARLLVQSVDVANYTPRLYAVAMDAYLAAADPAGFCPLASQAVVATDDPRWQAAQAICASFSSDQGMATSLLNQTERRGALRGVDYRLAEKTVGAGPNSRRQVKVEWDGVDGLSPWRFGLATATNVEIPADLFRGASDAYRAWEARAPALSLGRRLAGVSAASRLGVFSGDAAIGFYTQLGDPQGDDTQAPPANLFETFRRAYAGETVGERVQAMHDFWSMAPADGSAAGPGGVSYGALPALARAAAKLPPSAEVGADMPWLLAAMFSGGYDRNAANWARAVDAMDGDGKERAWALLAVGLEGTQAAARDRIDAFVNADTSENKVASRMLVAALYGLGRLPADQAAGLASDLGTTLAINSRWSRELAKAAARRQKGTVALLAAVGMQTPRWSQMPPEHLAAILSAMRSVGLEPEARMIAAEAVTRL